MGIFYDLISESPIFNQEMAIGYSDSEIQKISRLYDISISEMLYEYFHDIGRCNSTTHDGYIHLKTYATRSVYNNIASHIDFQNDMTSSNFEYFASQNIFYFASEGDGYEMFLATSSNSPDQLLCWNRNDNQIYDSDMTIYDFIKHWTFEYAWIHETIAKRLEAEKRRYWIGELIDFNREGENIVTQATDNS